MTQIVFEKKKDMEQVLREKLALLFLVLTTSLSYGQIGFDFFLPESNGYSLGIVATEVDDGYLISGDRDSLSLLIKLDLDGEIIDSTYFGNKTTLYYTDNVFETDSSYLVIGTTFNEQDTFPSFWMGEFTKDLEFQNEYLFPFPWNKSNRNINYTWDVGRDTVLFAAGKSIGWFNMATKEIAYENNNYYYHWNNILPRRDSIGYLVSGLGIKYTDDTLKTIKINPFWQKTLGAGFAGVNIKYINDTTFFLATTFECLTSRELVKKGDLGVFVGVMDHQFNLLYHDTLSMYRDSTAWGLFSPRLKILAQSSDSTFIVGGMTHPHHSSFNRIYCAKYNEKAERIWGGILYTPEEEQFHFFSILGTQDGGAMLTGARRTPDAVVQLYIIKIGPDGLITSETSIPINFSPIKVYPNPTSDYITFDLAPSSKELEFKLIDLQGHIVLRQKVTEQEEISTSHLPKGIYAYQLLDEKGRILYAGKMVKE